MRKNPNMELENQLDEKGLLKRLEKLEEIGERIRREKEETKRRENEEWRQKVQAKDLRSERCHEQWKNNREMEPEEENMMKSLMEVEKEERLKKVRKLKSKLDKNLQSSNTPTTPPPLV